MSTELPRLFLARHGDTAWTESRQHTGRTDIPLNERGEDRARQIGARLREFSFVRVFTSPLQRASKTCQLAGYGAVAEVVADLVEWDYGRYEGLLTKDILQERPGWEMFREGCPGGESPEDVALRADRFIARARASDGDVLAFSSGHIIRMIAARWLALPPAASFSADLPASVFWPSSTITATSQLLACGTTWLLLRKRSCSSLRKRTVETPVTVEGVGCNSWSGRKRHD